MPGLSCNVGDTAVFEEGVHQVTTGCPSHFRRCQNAATVTSDIEGGVCIEGEPSEFDRCQNACTVGNACMHPEDGPGVLVTGGPESSICSVNNLPFVIPEEPTTYNLSSVLPQPNPNPLANENEEETQ